MFDLKKQLPVILGAALLSIVLGYLLNQSDSKMRNSETYQITDVASAIIPQNVVATSDKPHEVVKIYQKDTLIGILNNTESFESNFDRVYEAEYKDKFENSKLGPSEDVYTTKALSYNSYENKDIEIFNYLYDQGLLAIEAHKIEFSNGAIIYVKNIEDFERAREGFIKNFVSSDDVYNVLKKGEKLPPMTGYGEREIALSVKETIQVTPGFAPVDKIMQDEATVLKFLSYGYDPSIETYEVERFDTVDGIGWKHGMTGSQILSLNRDKIVSREQLLQPGTVLNVSKFDSPLTVEVVRERRIEEIVYPEDIEYVEDPELKEGVEIIDVVERNGLRDVTYNDTTVNMQSVSSKRVSEHTTVEPIRGKVRVGTKIEPRIGSGKFRWPVTNGFITCAYGNSCYQGHNGTDFVYFGNGGLGEIYASDRGVVIEATYKDDWGNYVLIDHGNGYQTRYAHMRNPGSYVQVGEVVTAGQPIGYIGNTGRSFGAHVHFEVYQSGTRIDPCSVLGC